MSEAALFDTVKYKTRKMEPGDSFPESLYPEILRGINSFPKVLFYKGDIVTGLFDNCVAVVGSRNMTMYGRTVTRNLVSALCAGGITVVSGFMYGIDATAHASCVEFGGKTVAVMPCGIEMIHPPRQKDLYMDILQNGGLGLSEYDEEFPPCVWTYPRRNRIVAGLCKAVLVVEAGEDSGSLITAGFARKYGRRVMAVPGPVTSLVSAGTLKLIKEGADMVCSAEDLMRLLGHGKGQVIGEHFVETIENNLNKLSTKIISVLGKEPLDISMLSKILEIDIPLLSVEMTNLSLAGVICEREGMYYVS